MMSTSRSKSRASPHGLDSANRIPGGSLIVGCGSGRRPADWRFVVALSPLRGGGGVSSPRRPRGLAGSTAVDVPSPVDAPSSPRSSSPEPPSCES